MVLKRLFVSDTEEISSLYIHCSVLRETELQAILLGVRALRQYSSFSEKIVL